MNKQSSGRIVNTDAWLKDIYERVVCHDNKSYVFIEMNIKQFRYLNVKYGIQFGDNVLREMLDILMDLLKEAYVSHHHADIFDILIPYDWIKNDIRPLMSRIVDAIFDIDVPEIHHNIFVSFGIYYLYDYPDYEMLKTYAAIARKEEKTLYKRTFSYEVLNKPKAELLSAYLKKRELEEALTAARFQGEFEVFIQPKVNLKTHKVTGGEVLTRWVRSDGSMVPLSDFMPLLNENGEMYMIDCAHFETMCKILKEREVQDKKVVPISFNVTNRALFNDNFIEEYTRIYEFYKPRKDLIELEFMEDIHFEKGGEVLSAMKWFKDHGFTCSLDDFGNGISSFNVLLSGNIDIIKMDRLFFTGDLNEAKKQIIHDIIDIAKINHIKVLAEGIETKEFADFVEAEGCDYIQGFYYYKPMPLEDFFKLLDDDIECLKGN